MSGVVDLLIGEIFVILIGIGFGKVNGGFGDLWGYEFLLILLFIMFSEFLDGFGLIVSYIGVE